MKGIREDCFINGERKEQNGGYHGGQELGHRVYTMSGEYENEIKIDSCFVM